MEVLSCWTDPNSQHDLKRVEFRRSKNPTDEAKFLANWIIKKYTSIVGTIKDKN